MNSYSGATPWNRGRYLVALALPQVVVRALSGGPCACLDLCHLCDLYAEYKEGDT